MEAAFAGTGELIYEQESGRLCAAELTLLQANAVCSKAIIQPLECCCLASSSPAEQPGEWSRASERENLLPARPSKGSWLVITSGFQEYEEEAPE